MSYSYANQRSNLFTEEGQVMFLKFRDNTRRLLATAGAARMAEMMSGLSGDTWDMHACADRMVELGEIKELTDSNTFGQHRVFTSVST